MLYLYEFLFTFFLIFFYTTDTKFASAQTASIIFTTFIAYSLDKNTYLNTGIAFSFLFTGYRNFLQVLTCIGIQLFAFVVVFLLKIAIQERQTDMKVENVSLVGFLLAEFLCGFFMTFYYYSLLIDIRSIKEGAATIAGVTLFYGGLQMAFPTFSAGHFLLAMANYPSIKPAMVALIGNIFGSLLGSMVYKFMICENNDLKNREIQANENNQQVDF